MDWKSLAGKLAQAGAPIIGTALGGPLGGMIGGAIGNVLASALGTDATPEAVDAALNNTPPDVLAGKLAAADAEAAAKWPALAEMAKAEAEDRTAQSRAINQTIRAELGHVSWYHWRHLTGYVVVLFGVEAALLLPSVVFKIITAEQMAAILGAMTPFMVVVSGLLGYVAQDTTRQKITAATGEPPPTITETIKTAIKARKK